VSRNEAKVGPLVSLQSHALSGARLQPSGTVGGEGVRGEDGIGGGRGEVGGGGGGGGGRAGGGDSASLGGGGGGRGEGGGGGGQGVGGDWEPGQHLLGKHSWPSLFWGGGCMGLGFKV